MAGSYRHVVDFDERRYTGLSLLENMGDMAEAVEMMAFMLLMLQHRWGGDRIVGDLERDYYECRRGERPWPEWWSYNER